MLDYQSLSYEYENKAIEQIRKINECDEYQSFLQIALEYLKLSINFGESELSENNYNIFDKFSLWNVISEVEDAWMNLDEREIGNYTPQQESDIYNTNFKYSKDIVEFLEYISQVYDKYIPDTQDDVYCKQLIMYYILLLCRNRMVLFDNHVEYIGLHSHEKQYYIQIFDTLKDKGVHKIKFANYDTYFQKELLNCTDVDRDSVDEFQAKQEIMVNRVKQQYAKPGCYIATCVYGSYDCPQVWTLRRFRDYKLSHSFIGHLFIKVYYTISPRLVKTFGEKALFRKFGKGFLDKLVKNLMDNGYDDTPYYDR